MERIDLDDVDINISKFITLYRKSRKLTQADLANLLGVSKLTIGNWENNKSMPNLQTLIKLSKALNVTLDELVCGEKSNINDDDIEKYENISIYEVGNFFSNNDMLFLISNNFLTLKDLFVDNFYLKINSFSKYPLNERMKLIATVNILKCKYLNYNLDFDDSLNYTEFEHNLGLSFKKIMSLHFELGINTLHDLLILYANNDIKKLYEKDLGYEVVEKIVVIYNYFMKKGNLNLSILTKNESSMNEIYVLYDELKDLIMQNETLSLQIKKVKDELESRINMSKRK